MKFKKCLLGSTWHIVLPTLFALIGTIGTAWSTPREQALDMPSLIIGDTPYNTSDLTGFSTKGILWEIEAGVTQLSDTQIEYELRRYISLSEARKLSDLPRNEREYALVGAALKHLSDHAIKLRVLADITHKICLANQIKLDDYFDLPVIEDALNRQIAYIDFRYNNQKLPPEKDRELFDRAVKEFRFARPFSYWAETAQEFRQRPAYARLEAETFKYSHQKGYLIPALLAHDLFKKACENPEGIFYKRGKARFQFEASNLMVIDIHNYHGERKDLEKLAADILNPDETVNKRALNAFTTTLHKAPSTARLTSRHVFGRELVSGQETPDLGVLVESTPGNFRIIGKVTPVPQAEAAEDGQGLFYKIYAYRIAAQSLMPSVKSLYPDWIPNLDLATSSLPTSGVQMVIPKVEIAPYIKKVYSGKIFAEIKKQ